MNESHRSGVSNNVDNLDLQANTANFKTAFILLSDSFASPIRVYCLTGYNRDFEAAFMCEESDGQAEEGGERKCVA